MKPLLVFDLDGTIADTAPDLVAALNAAITQEGLRPLALAEMRPLVGAGARALIQRAFAAQDRLLDPGKLDELFRAFIAHYEAHIADGTQLFPGLVDALDRLERQGFAFAVCTNKIEGASRILLGVLGIADRFQAICGQDTFAITKPDPRILLKTIEQAGGARDNAIMIGDSGTDVATAQAADVPVVAVTFGYTDRPIAEFGPDRIIDHFDRLDEAVEGLRSLPRQAAASG